MSSPARLGAFAATLAVVFAGAALAGDAIGPERAQSRADGGHGAASAGDGAHDVAGGANLSASPHADETTGPVHGAGKESFGAHPPRGLAVAENGLRVIVDDVELRRGRSESLRFRIVDERGGTVREFDTEHEKRMHVIVVRRDLTGFQHLHPEQVDDGSWRVPLKLEDAGSYRLFADFSHTRKPYTLASDLRVDGNADLRALPAPVSTANSDGGHRVRLDAGRARAGEEAALRFTITKDGDAVHTEPYLGAGGHLVALREGDLAFLHVHPNEAGHAADAGDEQAAAHDDSIGFAATFPTQGRYRLFLQFKHEGSIHTVAFTQEVN